MKHKANNDSPVALIYTAAKEIIDGTRRVLDEHDRDATEIRIPIIMHGTDMRVTIEAGPKVAARNLIEQAQVKASIMPAATKHTPGPWLVDFEQDDLDSRASVLRVLDSRSLDHPQGPLVIATVNVAAHAPHLEEPLRNASLIAAAPDLLQALKTIMAQVAGCEREPHWEAARAAIEKAEDA